MTYCTHDLDMGACGDCSPPAGQPPLAPELWGPWFTADYSGTCAGCGDGILPDDEIRADGDGGWLCQYCGQEG